MDNNADTNNIDIDTIDINKVIDNNDIIDIYVDTKSIDVSIFDFLAFGDKNNAFKSIQQSARELIFCMTTYVRSNNSESINRIDRKS